MQDTEFQPIEAYVPHRGAMRLVDRMLELSEEHAVAEVVVPADGLFVREGRVPAWVGLEYMAQTVAAWAGGRARRQGGPVKIGFLLGCRRYESKQPDFASGVVLRIEARCELIGDNGLGQFACRILDAQGQVVADAMVSVFEPPGDAGRVDAPTSKPKENP